MKKYILSVVICILVVSCEKDDFCTQEIASHLIIRFMDKDSISKNKMKSVDSLCVWAKDKDSLYKNVNLDSIVLPLNSMANETIYNISTSKDSVINLTISYNTKEEFISRSCGYRVLFNNISVNENAVTNSWINSIETKTTTTNNQNNAHIKIYH